MAPSDRVRRTLEWCDRRLLQRIHRLTVGRLRKEIEPLSAQDFMRFLFRWHHLEPSDALGGQGGLLRAVSLLEGYEAPAAAWEQVLLPARVRGERRGAARTSLLDRRGRLGSSDPAGAAGRRASPRRRGGAAQLARALKPGRNATLTFVRRAELGSLLGAARWDADASTGPRTSSSPSRAVARRPCAARSLLLRRAGVRLAACRSSGRGCALGSARAAARDGGRG